MMTMAMPDNASSSSFYPCQLGRSMDSVSKLASLFNKTSVVMMMTMVMIMIWIMMMMMTDNVHEAKLVFQ